MPPTAFGGRLAQTLLRILATRRGSVVPRDELVEHLWPDRPPADPSANLTVLASRIRRATAAPWLVTATAGGYLLPASGPCAVDAELFVAEVADGAHLLGRGLPAEALDRLEGALARWTGEPLVEDLYADWAQPHRRHLEQTRMRALEDAARAALAVGNADLALRRADQAVTSEPLRESAQLLRIQALAAAGNPAGAAESFAAFRRVLAEETGLEPTAEARAVHQQLLRGLLRRAASRSSGAPGRRTHRGTAESLFVGREGELAAVLRAAARPGAVVLEGVSGAGKSRLLAEVARRADGRVVGARSFLAERDEAWALARHLLRELLSADVPAGRDLPDRMAVALADVLPELEDVRRIPSLAIEPDSRRALVMEGALRLTDAALGGGLLLLDDLQWADPSSLALLDRIRGRLPHVGMVLAYRPEEVGSEDPLLGVVGRMLHDGTVPRLRIGPLDAAALRDLVTDDSLAAELAQHTDRTPMAVLEVLRTLGRSRAVTPRDDGRWSPAVPHADRLVADAARAGQRRAVRARAAAQPPVARDLLRMLALLGREIPARVLVDALGRSQQEVLADLDRLAHAGLARLGERGWAPAHDLIGESVAEGLDAATRGALHQVLARALAADAADAAELARHLAGAGDADAAARAFADAARDRLEHHADEEARQLADAGIVLGARATIRAELLEVRAEARARSGDLPGAGEDLRSALRVGVPRPDRARLLARHARLAAGADDLAHAEDLVTLALAETGGDPGARAAALYAGAIIDMNIDRPERGRERADEALRLFEQVGDAGGMADILDARAMAVCLDGRNHEAAAAFDRVARLFLDVGDLLRVVTPRSTRGHCLVFMGRPQEALAESGEAVDLARSLGWSEGISYALWHRSEAFSALGRVDEALRDAREAVDLAERLGHRSWTVAGHRALGVALQAAGDLGPAEQAFCRALELARHWPLFVSWACARVALVRLTRGDPDGAAPYVARALAEGPPLAHYEARWAAAELAAARDAPDAASIARDALARARQGGHLVAVPRLAELADRSR